MPLVITCPRCGGHGVVNLGMTWKEAINLAECVIENVNMSLESVYTRTDDDGNQYFTVVAVRAPQRFEIKSMSEYLDIARQIAENIAQMEKEQNASTSGNTSATSK